MSSPAPEFARPVSLARLASGPFRQQIAATEAERTALAKRFDLVSLDRLVAEIELAREAGGTILLTATFEANFAQSCIVTLDPVGGSVAERFQLRYGPPEAEADFPAGVDAPAFEPLAEELVDIGEAVAQEFALALPPFPRASDAVVEPRPVMASSEGPFAFLARLAPRGPK